VLSDLKADVPAAEPYGLSATSRVACSSEAKVPDVAVKEPGDVPIRYSLMTTGRVGPLSAAFNPPDHPEPAVIVAVFVPSRPHTPTKKSFAVVVVMGPELHEVEATALCETAVTSCVQVALATS
jgi:hypothetical protein